MDVDISAGSHIAENLARVRERIARSAEAGGRPPETVRLVAVSKTYGLDAVRAAHAAGQLAFGENRVQEARGKIEDARDLGLEWHLVGHLQSNKIRRAASLFSVIHSIDRIETLRAVDTAAHEMGRRPDVLIQVDLAAEATKHGAPRTEVATLVAAAAECVAVRLVGLMLLPPFTPDPEDARPYFRMLRTLRDDLAASAGDGVSLRELSMGMSHDFQVAIAEGATIVRVGSAIFGARHVRAV